MNDETLLEAMLKRGLTPNFSFPLDTCTFTAEGLEGWRAKTFANMTQDLRKALREYSPGRTISVDGREYRVGGLTWFDHSNDPVDRARPYVGDEEAQSKHLKWYSRCSRRQCGWVYGSIEEGFTGEACPNCGASGDDQEDMENHKPIVSRWLRPEGFAPIVIPWHQAKGEAKADRPNPSSQQGRSKFMQPEEVRNNATMSSMGGRVELPAPLDNSGNGESQFHLIHHEGIFDDHVEFLTTRPDDTETEGVELILMNTGYLGRGFWLCPACGRTEVERENGFDIGGEGHHRPYVPAKVEGENQRCKEVNFFGNKEGSNPDRVMVGMTFRTDVSIIRFALSEDTFVVAQDLAKNRELDSAIRALKEALLTEINAAFELEEREISAGYRKWKRDTGDNVQTLVIDLFFYDEVSGGAGLCTNIFSEEERDRLKTAVDNTLLRLSGNSCSNGTGCDRVCIGCLLDFRNSMDHDYMDRRHGLRLLTWLRNKELLPRVETDTDQESNMSVLEHYANFIQCRQGHHMEVGEDGILRIKHTESGETTFRLRPVSSYLRDKKDPALKDLNTDYKTRRLNINEKRRPVQDVRDDRRGKKIIHTVPMNVIRSETVALERRMFGPRPQPGIESVLRS